MPHSESSPTCALRTLCLQVIWNTRDGENFPSSRLGSPSKNEKQSILAWLRAVRASLPCIRSSRRYSETPVTRLLVAWYSRISVSSRRLGWRIPFFRTISQVNGLKCWPHPHPSASFDIDPLQPKRTFSSGKSWNPLPGNIRIGSSCTTPLTVPRRGGLILWALWPRIWSMFIFPPKPLTAQHRFLCVAPHLWSGSHACQHWRNWVLTKVSGMHFRQRPLGSFGAERGCLTFAVIFPGTMTQVLIECNGTAVTQVKVLVTCFAFVLFLRDFNTQCLCQTTDMQQEKLPFYTQSSNLIHIHLRYLLWRVVNANYSDETSYIGLVHSRLTFKKFRL